MWSSYRYRFLFIRYWIWYSFNNPKDIEIGYFSDKGTDAKVPTEIILDKNLNILAFGEECNEYISSNQLKFGDLYFKKIKINLYKNQDTIQPENNTESFSLSDIIAKVLEYVKEEAIKKVHSNRDYIVEDQIKWVVTVWDEKKKGIMIKACEKAKLFNKNTNKGTFFALEPEAASLYCSQNEAVDPNYIMPGKIYIICDLGGITGDIVTHTKTNDNKITEKYQAIGGPYGSDEIDKEIFNILIGKLFGFGDYKTLKNKNEKMGFPWKEDELFWQWSNLQFEIQKKKRLIIKLKIKNFL